VTGWLNSRTPAKYPKPAQRQKPKPIRRKAKRKAKLHDADKLFSTYIRTRDDWACVRCGSPVMPQCAHLHSRAYRAIRWNPDNATTLCKGCHVLFTHRPIEWADWCEERWPGRLATLRVQALAVHEHPDYDAICAQFKAAIGMKP
jgi:5-methylcytosine-specific restriction endonuclease McrA